MSQKSHIDMEKFKKVPSGHPFEYKDIVKEDYPLENRTQDGKRFKSEVEKGLYDAVIREDDTDRVQYEKL